MIPMAVVQDVLLDFAVHLSTLLVDRLQHIVISSNVHAFVETRRCSKPVLLILRLRESWLQLIVVDNLLCLVQFVVQFLQHVITSKKLTGVFWQMRPHHGVARRQRKLIEHFFGQRDGSLQLACFPLVSAMLSAGRTRLRLGVDGDLKEAFGCLAGGFGDNIGGCFLLCLFFERRGRLVDRP